MLCYLVINNKQVSQGIGNRTHQFTDITEQTDSNSPQEKKEQNINML